MKKRRSHIKTDTDRAAAFVCKFLPKASPNGWIVDEPRSILTAVRRDERRKLKARAA